ncbi:unnamed protein product, partial [Tilletia laevis]
SVFGGQRSIKIQPAKSKILA